MKMHPEDKTGDCYKRGLQAEEIFTETMEGDGYSARPATPYEDGRKHIDTFLEKGGETESYEVKGLRKFFRRRKYYNNSHALLEISKNQGKRDGTAFTTESDHMVFFRKGEFLVFSTKGLREVCEKYVKFDESVGYNDYEDFKLKLRKSGGWNGRSKRIEELTIIPYSFLKEKLPYKRYEHNYYKDYKTQDINKPDIAHK